MKKLFLTCMLFLAFITLIANASQLNISENPDNNFKHERATVANALQLSEEQLEKWQQITEQYNLLYEDYLLTLHEECAKMKNLKQENASQKVLDNQQKIINNIQNNIENIMDKELKARKKILTGEQKSKLRMIQKLTKKAINESEKQTNYYKLNPKMRNFAPKKISN